jgi:hypothetical protein
LANQEVHQNHFLSLLSKKTGLQWIIYFHFFHPVRNFASPQRA